MSRIVALTGVLAALLGLTLGGYVVAQDAGTPTTTDDCATPSANATPDAVVMGTNGAVAPSPEVLYPCTTPTSDGEQTGAHFTVVMTEFSIYPKTLTIPANQDVVITLLNAGVVPHNFHVGGGTNVHSEDISPGGETTVTINAGPGIYDYFCAIPGHKGAGMAGTLIVQ